MKSHYIYYIKAFVKCSQTAFDNRRLFKTITPFALIISDKANELIRRATLNSDIDLPNLQKEIFELGSKYIRQFADHVSMMDTIGGDGWLLKICNPKDIFKRIEKSRKPNEILPG